MSRKNIIRLVWPLILLIGIPLQWMLFGWMSFGQFWFNYTGWFSMRDLGDLIEGTIRILPLSLALIFWFLRPGKRSFICTIIAGWGFSAVPGTVLLLLLLYQRRMPDIPLLFGN